MNVLYKIKIRYNGEENFRYLKEQIYSWVHTDNFEDASVFTQKEALKIKTDLSIIPKVNEIWLEVAETFESNRGIGPKTKKTIKG